MCVTVCILREFPVGSSSCLCPRGTLGGGSLASLWNRFFIKEDRDIDFPLKTDKFKERHVHRL